jgi:hypothetical protein
MANAKASSGDDVENRFERLMRPAQKQQPPPPPQPEQDDEQENDDAERLKVASLNLVSVHRAMIAGMLGMVKKEMHMVNSTDADRDGIEDYLEGLEILQDKKIEMIGNVREALGAWKEARATKQRPAGGRLQQRRMSASKWLRDAGGEFEEDEEDLR